MMSCTNMNSKFLFFCLIGLNLDFVLGKTLDEQFQIVSRDKRYLTYTYGSAIGMFLAFAVPLEIPDRDVLFSYNFEANYNLPTNLSQYDLTPPILDRSFFESFNRTYLYQLLQKNMGSFGDNGRDCLLSTICEVGRSPLTHNGLIGHFIHVMLSPSSSLSEGLKEEEEAEQKGRDLEDCSKLYNCSRNFLDDISEWAYEI
ncbi:uncharacterized protein [Halyomorpha halys]|uniref:uncharacterized protein n=1 Tax=Halyomorpha halys TaxID=286706 RepID=UPI0006D4F4DC|nr:uncharacterized protein LOC106678176 [Halyomorpha halys]